jgi:hypothetical protein
MRLETIADTKMPWTRNISTPPFIVSTHAGRTRTACTLKKASEFAASWIEAWNSHDLDRILALFSKDAVYSSSLVRTIGGGHSDSIRGYPALHSYFGAILRKFPSLHVQLRAVYTGSESLLLLCDSDNGLVACNKINLNKKSQVSRVWVYYGKLRQNTAQEQTTNPGTT